MIASMTGFARDERSGPFGTLVCELRSVNHRFLDATLRLPDACRALEPELRQALARELKRGKVDCSLQQRSQQAGASGLDIDQSALARLLGRLQELEAALPGRSQIDLIELLRWPGIVREESADAEGLSQAVRELFAATLHELASARAREGARLAALIEQRCAALLGLVT
ncbi:MAG: YicC/YloC family endoribonuclease, partial [Steroidobacteraceae bacterium]